MQTFTDTRGRAWTMDVNVLSARRVRTVLGIDLMDVLEPGGGLIDALYRNPVAIGEMAYAIAQPQAERLGVDMDEFLSALRGDCIHAARDAILEGLAGFFPQAPVREALRRMIDLIAREELAASAAASRRIASGQLDIDMASELGRRGSSSGGAPESPASTPGP